MTAALCFHFCQFSTQVALNAFSHSNIDQFNLTNAHFLAVHIKVFVITEDEVFCRNAVDRRFHLQHIHAHFFIINTSNSGKGFHSSLVSVGAGGGLEEHGVRKNGTHQTASNSFGDFDAIKIIHGFQHGASAAHGPNPSFERRIGGDIAQLVVVNNAQHISFSKTLGALSEVREVHQIHVLARHIINNGRCGQAKGIQHKLGVGGRSALSGSGNSQATLGVNISGGKSRNGAVSVWIHVTKNNCGHNYFPPKIG